METTMLASDLTLPLAILAGVGMALSLYGLLSVQSSVAAAQTVAQADRIAGGPGVGCAYQIADRLAAGRGASIERLLKQANWFWAPGDPTPPQTGVPYHSVRGYYATVIYRMLTYGLGGLLCGLIFVARGGLPLLLACGIGGVAALLGYVAPRSMLEGVVQTRQYQMTVEMAFRLPELAAIVSSGSSLVAALRRLTTRPGGPFVTEIARLLRVYDASNDLTTAMRAVINHNHFTPLTELCQQLLLVAQRGGTLGPAIQVQAHAAQVYLQHRLVEQGQQNAGAMQLPVVAGSLLVTIVLVAGPAVWYLVTTL